MTPLKEYQIDIETEKTDKKDEKFLLYFLSVIIDFILILY